MLKDLVNQYHSYRRFYEDVRIPFDELKDMIDIARIIGNVANTQPLEYKIICDLDQRIRVSPTIGRAAALKDRSRPRPDEHPNAYIAVVYDLSIGKNRQWDEGITSQTIVLNAVEKGYGGCIIGNCKCSGLLETLNPDLDKYYVGPLLALGEPKEEVIMVPVDEDRNTVYHRDKSQTHYIPKRNLEDILI